MSLRACHRSLRRGTSTLPSDRMANRALPPLLTIGQRRPSAGRRRGDRFDHRGHDGVRAAGRIRVGGDHRIGRARLGNGARGGRGIPQLIVATKALAGSTPLACVKVATVRLVSVCWVVVSGAETTIAGSAMGTDTAAVLL